MILKVVLKGVVLFHIFKITICSFKYELLPRDENIFSPCDGDGFTYATDYVDMSNLTIETLANGSFHVHGDVTIFRDIGVGYNPATIQAFKKNRGSWVSTIYNMRREDTCTYVFNENEMWSHLLKDVPQEHRTCPFHKGQTVSFNVATDIRTILPDPKLAGEYKLRLTVEFLELNEVLCVQIATDIFRI